MACGVSANAYRLRKADFAIRVARKQADRYGIELEPKRGKPGRTGEGR